MYLFRPGFTDLTALPLFTKWNPQPELRYRNSASGHESALLDLCFGLQGSLDHTVCGVSASVHLILNELIIQAMCLTNHFPLLLRLRRSRYLESWSEVKSTQNAG